MPTQSDRDQLKLLGIFTLVYAGIIAIVALATFAYMCVIAASTAFDSQEGSDLAAGIVVVIGAVVSGLFFLKSAWMLPVARRTPRHTPQPVSPLRVRVA